MDNYKYCYSAICAFFLGTIVVQAAENSDFCPASQQYIDNLLTVTADGSAVGLSTASGASSCLVTWYQLEESISEPLIIDIRTSVSNNLFPGTVPIKLPELKGKHFLKERSLVLLDKGLSSESLLKACHTLKQAGFVKVKALKGGVRSYAEANKYPVSRKELLISPRDFFLANHKQNLAIVAEQPNPLLGSTESISHDLDQQFQSIGIKVDHYYSAGNLQQTVIDKLADSDGFVPVVIIASGSASEEAVGLVSKLPNIYYLDGGLKALSKYQAANRWVNKRREGIPQRYLCGNV